MIKRKKRPYKDYWSMIGGKIMLEESIQEAALRHAKEKTGINAEFESVNSLLHERVSGDEIVKHSFILIFVKMKTKETKLKESSHGELEWFKITEIEKEKLIPSDAWLIKNKLNSKINYNEATMNEKDGELSEFNIVK